MSVGKLIDTTLVEYKSQAALRYLVIPAKYLNLQASKMHIFEIGRLLEIPSGKIVKPRDLVYKMGLILWAERMKLSENQINATTINDIINQADPALLGFCEESIYYPQLPPLEGDEQAKSLIELVTTASGTEIGAVIGFMVAWEVPFLMISVPAGLILCGSASGLGKALEAGLRERIIKRLFKGTDAEENGPQQ